MSILPSFFCIFFLFIYMVRHLGGNEIKEIEPFLFEPLTLLVRLNLSRNHIKVVPKNAFNGLLALQKLLFTGSRIQRITPGAFNEPSYYWQLQEIKLEDNNITVLEERTFQKCIRVNVLYLARSKITSIKPWAFSGLSRLRTLHLERNEIEVLVKETFMGLTFMNTLHLEKNKIKVIRSGAFDGSYVRYLHLEGNVLMNIEQGVFNKSRYFYHIFLQENKFTNLSTSEMFKGPSQINKLDLRKSSIEVITPGVFRGVQIFELLDLSYNKITVIQNATFIGGYGIEKIDLSFNNIATLQQGAFNGILPLSRWREIYILKILDLSSNYLMNISQGMLDGLVYLQHLSLSRNKIEEISLESFKDLKSISGIHLSENRCAFDMPGLFNGSESLSQLNIANNRITVIKSSVFKSLTNLRSLDLSNNQIEWIDYKALQGMLSISFLMLEGNRLTYLDERSFQTMTEIHTLQLHNNKLRTLPRKLISNNTKLSNLNLQNNQLTTLPHFENNNRLRYLFLSHNKLENVPQTKLSKPDIDFTLLDNNRIWQIRNFSFQSTPNVLYIMISNNPIKVIADEAFHGVPLLKIVTLLDNQLIVPLNIWPTKSEITFLVSGNADVILDLADHEGDISYFGKTGFICDFVNKPNSCKACTRGTFKSRSPYEMKCYACPAGGFYQDETAYIGPFYLGYGCKKCPNGSYVKPELAPGKSQTQCQSCPIGTDSKLFAKFRACRCMDGYYRLDRFGPCTICTKGYSCSNESIDLAPEFYWVWESQQLLQDYKTFTKDLIITNASYKYRKFNYSIPDVYACPIQGSCLGRHLSKCSDGYKGPLCAVCDKGYFSMIGKCQICPSLPWIIGQMVCLVVVVVIFILFILWEKKKQARQTSRTITDIFLARLKIIIGFYQISSSTFDSFSYIKWPGPIRTMMKYAKLLQLNLLQIAPLNCINSTLKSNAYANLQFSIGISAMLIIIGVLVRFFIRCYLKNKTTISEEGKRVQEFEFKQKTYRCLILLFFITFPSTCTHILQMLPAACHKICSNQEVNCNSYLKADYSVRCSTPKHNIYGTLSTIAIVYCIGFPLTLFLFLRRAQRQGKLGNASSNDKGPILNALRFLYENYSPMCWFWEIVELARKIFFTSLLILMNAESRTSLGLTSMFSGMYSVLFVFYKPVEDAFEHWLQMASLLASSVNFTVGMLMKVPSEETSSGVGEQTDGLLVTVILVFANVAVVAIIAVKYLSTFLAAIVRWKNEPKCNVSCCLEILQLVSDAQGEVGSVCTEPKINENLFGDAGGDQPTLDGVQSNIQGIEENVEENEEDKTK